MKSPVDSSDSIEDNVLVVTHHNGICVIKGIYVISFGTGHFFAGASRCHFDAGVAKPEQNAKIRAILSSNKQQGDSNNRAKSFGVDLFLLSCNGILSLIITNQHIWLQS